MKLQVEYIPISEIRPYERNAKLHPASQIKQIVRSIEEFGFRDPIGIYNGEIVEGHGRYFAALDLGMEEVPVIRLDDMTDEQRKAYALVHNKLTMNSDFNLDLLEIELGDIADIDMTEFGFELDTEPEEVIEDEYEEPEKVEQRAKLGDLFQLGNHRLMCGDSTDPAVIDRLMDGVKAKLLLTDPPYNMEMGGHGKTSELGKRGEKLRNSIEHIADFDAKDIEYIFSIFDNISIYIFTSKNLVGDYLNFAKGWNFNILVWNKTNPAPLVNNTFLSDLEYIMFFYRGERVWNNGLKPFDIYSKCYTSSITEGSKDAGKIHPTMKPIQMLSNFIRLSSNENDIILDLFGGSGSTLIACEQLNRKCYMCELDPHYVDVIIDRWEKLTGQKAVLLNG